jgi:hypothetical protein
MPNLPTLNVSQEQADRIMAAFAPGGTQAEAVARYKKWLRFSVIKYVQAEESLKMRAENRAAEEAHEREILDAFPDPDAPPPTP